MFWNWLENQKVTIVGRRVLEVKPIFERKGVQVAHTLNLDGYAEINKVLNELTNQNDWTVAIIAAGIPATILAPKLAKASNCIAIDFGHGLDRIIEGNEFNHDKIVKEWYDKN